MMIYRETVKLCEMFVKLLTNEKKYAIMYHRKQQRRCFGNDSRSAVAVFFVYNAERMYLYETD